MVVDVVHVAHHIKPILLCHSCEVKRYSGHVLKNPNSSLGGGILILLILVAINSLNIMLPAIFLMLLRSKFRGVIC